MAAENEHRAISLLDLPNEVLGVICSQLCIHCQLIQSADIDQETTAVALQGQQALARLSRCSKLLQQIAQPVLFHFFCSERPPPDLELPEYETPEIVRAVYRRAINQLSAFVRAILRRPDLQIKVRVLTLYTARTLSWDYADDEDEEIAEWQDTVIKPLYREAFGELACILLVDAITSVKGLQDLQDLQDLALALCRSTLEDLLLERSRWRREWAYELPRLTRLSLPGCYRLRAKTYVIDSAQSFLEHAPSPRVLVAPDSGRTGYKPANWGRRSWGGVILPSLTRLSVSNVSSSHLVKILKRCPALEDLEYQYEVRNTNEDFWPATDLDAVRDTLRRLCFSSVNLGFTDFRPCEDQTDMPVTTLDEMCLASYSRLEVLEIDRCFLCGKEGNTGSKGGGNHEGIGADDTAAYEAMTSHLSDQDASEEQEEADFEFYTATSAAKFLGLLPPALRKLRVGFVTCWPAMYRDAIALASQAPQRFPNLREVSILVAKKAPEADVRELVSVFSASRIAASVGLADMYCGEISRGLLPPRPGMTPKETREVVAYEGFDGNRRYPNN